MLKLFGAGKTDHPLGDMREVRRVIAELPRADAAKSLDEITHWIESVRREETFRPDHAAAVLQLFDETAQDPIRRLSREYLSSPRLSKHREHVLWTGIHRYWKEAALGFARILELYVAGGKAGEALKGYAPLFAVRGLRAMAAQLKWLHARYGPLDETLWAMTSRMYAIADSKGFSRHPVAPYPAVPGESTPEREYLRAIMLEACSPDSLLPLEAELAERLIAQFSPLFTLSAQQQDDSAYWIDVARAEAPCRIQRPPQHQSIGLRYFAGGQAFAEIERLADGIRVTKEVPADVNLGGSYPADAVLHVLEHLRLHWSPKLPERRHQRHRVKSRLTVAYGFDGAVDALEPEVSLTFDGSDRESWIVENVSAGGFGALIPQVKGDWLRIGCLVALQPEGGDNWLLGIIRRLSRPTLQQAQVGIQTIARNARPVALRVKAGETLSLDVERGLMIESQAEGEMQLVVRNGVHEPGLRFVIDGAPDGAVLLPIAPSERGADFELLRVRQMVRDAA
jgi:hypothetical protein